MPFFPLINYTYHLVLLYFSFPFALWLFGKRTAKNILKAKSKIRNSWEFSLGVNTLIWTVFFTSQLLIGNSTDILIWGIATVGVILVLSIITTFTIGIFIVKKTEKKIKVST